ncbi:MAG: acyl carrier protein [Bacteroidales bacterium]|nr:acyl carrier protein [Bacteroidales bacterium]
MQEVIKKYVIKEYVEDDTEVTNDTPLISGGIVDSFSMVSLKRFLENKYQISIPDDKATPEAFDSVNKICMLVKEYLK